MRLLVTILATCFFVAEARGRHYYSGERHAAVISGGNGGRETERAGAQQWGYDWSRNRGRDWQSRFQSSQFAASNRRGELDEARRGTLEGANDPTETRTTAEEQPRWGYKQGRNWQREWIDAKRYKKYGSFRWLPDNDRPVQQQRSNESRTHAEESDRHRHGSHEHHRGQGPDHDRHHRRGPTHHGEHGRHDRHHHEHRRHHEHERHQHEHRRHHEHERHQHGHRRHHEHDEHHRHHDSHEGRRHHGPPHGHHDRHRWNKEHRNSSGSGDSWSRRWSGTHNGSYHHLGGYKGQWNSSRSENGSSGTGGRSWYKDYHRYHHKHRWGHRRYGSSSEESWSRGGSHEDRRGKKCRKKAEQPSYNVTCKSSAGYEVRRYEESVWVTTRVNSSSYEMAGKCGFKRLFKYISGHNNGSIKINMTKPVRKVMEVASEGPRNWTRNVMRSVSFFLPREFWDNPPEPLDGNISIERFPAYDVFAYEFGGYATEHKVKEKHRRVQHILEMKEQSFLEGYFAVQGFDPPWIFYRRHNEILIPADTEGGTPSCPEEFPNGIRQCRDTECPTYTQIEELSEHVFVREVEAGVYATKKSSTCNISAVMDDTYMPLHEYFQGDNLGSASIPRTAPVLQLAVRPETTIPGCNFTYQTTFYIPEAYQESPPVPNDETIIVANVGPTKYYVIKFSETPTPKTTFEKYSELKSFLEERELCYFHGIFQLAFYDAPWRPRPHLYELSVPADETCLGEILVDFDEELFPRDEGGQIQLPLINDDPNPVPYILE